MIFQRFLQKTLENQRNFNEIWERHSKIIVFFYDFQKNANTLENQRKFNEIWENHWKIIVSSMIFQRFLQKILKRQMKFQWNLRKWFENHCFCLNDFPKVLAKSIRKSMKCQWNLGKSVENHCFFNDFPKVLAKILENQ